MWDGNDVRSTKHRVFVSSKGRRGLKIMVTTVSLEFLVFHASENTKIDTNEQTYVRVEGTDRFCVCKQWPPYFINNSLYPVQEYRSQIYLLGFDTAINI